MGELLGMEFESSRVTFPAAEGIPSRANLNWNVTYNFRNHLARWDILFDMRRFKKPLDGMSEFIANQPIAIHGPNTFRHTTVGQAISEAADNLCAVSAPMNLPTMIHETWKVGRPAIQWEMDDEDESEPSTGSGGETTQDEMVLGDL